MRPISDPAASTRLAEQALRQGRSETATGLAERALALAGDAIPDIDTLVALLPILRAGNSPMAEVARAAAVDLGHDLDAERRRTDGGRIESAPLDDRLARTRIERPFFGRQTEMAEIEDAMATTRTVAITGLGGVGKTELARRVAAALVGDRPRESEESEQPVWIDAGAVTSAALLPEILSRQLAEEEGPAADLDELAALIGGRRLVIVLDGVDAIATELGPLAGLVEACPGLRLLVTSRAPVELGGCRSIALEGLPVQPTGAGHGPAVELFLAWFARHAPVGTELDEDDGAATEICRLLDGHPLAIELAAGWLNILTPAEVAAGLTTRSADGDHLLIGEGGDGVIAVMASTWELLDPTCRRALARLSVLPGGYDRSVAEAVGGADLATLRRLASWSLVTRWATRWYGCHPLVQAYARNRLAEDPDEEDQARTAHADLVMDAVAGAPNVDAFDAGTVLDAVEDPVANVLAVFTDRVEQGRFDAVAALVDPLDRLLGFHGRHLTLLETLEQAVAMVADRPGSEGVSDRLEMHLVWHRLRLGAYREAATIADRLLAGRSGEGDGPAPDLVVELTRARSAIDRTEGDVDRALERLLAVRDVAGTVSERLEAMVDDDIGLCQMVLGLYPESRQSYRSVLAWARRTGSQPMIARTLLSLGIGHHDGGEILDSLAYLVEAKSVVTVNDLRHLEPYVDVKLARTHLADGDTEAAATILEGARARSGSAWEPWLAAEFDLVSARLAAATDDPEAMWMLLERSLTTSADLNDIPFVAKAFVALVDLGTASGEVGPPGRGAVELVASVARDDSGADHADRHEARSLLEHLSAISDGGDASEIDDLAIDDLVAGAAPIADRIDDAYTFLRRGRLLSSRHRGSAVEGRGSPDPDR